MKATSASAIWLGPSEARVAPAWVPTSLSPAPPMTAISIWSKARSRKRPKVLANGILPPLARPAAAETMFCSAMRASK